MAITIQNLRIAPYVQKNELKCVWGDTLTLTFAIPHVAGESYVCGIDNERVVYPPSRPVCAYTNVFTRDGDNVTFSLPLNTSKFRSYVSSIRKPMPVWLQVCRVGIDGKCETLVLDDILAIPSVLDATNTVCPGDPLKQLLEGKMDKPASAGAEGQVLTMDADGHYAWADLPHIPEDPVQSDWDESDSSNLSYIRNKPAISKVGHTGEYSDLLNRPDLKAVATTGSYNDLIDKPSIPPAQVQADYGESDSGAVDYIKHKPDLSVYSLVTETGNSIAMSIDDDYDLVVSLLDKNGNTLSTQDIDLPIESMVVDATYANGVLTLTLQNGNTLDVDISDIVSGLVPDSRKVNGHALDEDVTISYNDLTDKPVIPAAQIQSDWDESDSQAVDFIRNKPVIPEQVQSDWDQSDSQAVDYIKGKPSIPAAQVQSNWDESDSSSPAYILNKPAISGGGGDADYLCFTADQANSTVRLDKSGIPTDISIEYSTDRQNWTTYTWIGGIIGENITLSAIGKKVWFRATSTNSAFSTGITNYYNFVLTGKVNAGGNIMSLVDKSCISTVIPSSYCFIKLFSNCTSLTGAPYLPATTLTQYCYAYLFSGCTGLKKATEFPATTLASYCYFSTFSGCTSLTIPPELPATALATYCYHSMFYGCTSLASAPVLPAITMANYCYADMFKGCTYLYSAPDLPAKTLADHCYYQMFMGCTSMVKAMEVLPATTLTAYVYNEIFSGCTSLKRAPEFMAVNAAYQNSMCGMFDGCSNLEYVPDLHVTSLYGNCFDSCFRNCVKLTVAPEVPATTGVRHAFERMFYGCTGLKYYKCNLTSLSTEPFANTFTNITGTGVFDCPSTVDPSSVKPANWITVHGANTPDEETTSIADASTADTFAVCPGQSETGVITVASALTLSAGYTPLNTAIAYAEVVIDLAASATVTAGTNIIFVDTPTDGKRNVCIVRWQGGSARLYVVDTMDLPQA